MRVACVYGEDLSKIFGISVCVIIEFEMRVLNIMGVDGRANIPARVFQNAAILNYQNKN